jgi:ketosteroid isomerase-like protein
MTPPYTTADEVETAFYQAIERGDLEALMALWADDDEITCIHPSGQRTLGHTAIRQSWQHVFKNGVQLRIQLAQQARWSNALIEIHHLTETFFVGRENKPHGPILATNIYIRTANGWRLLAHHASNSNDPVEPANPPPVMPSRVLH